MKRPATPEDGDAGRGQPAALRPRQGNGDPASDASNFLSPAAAAASRALLTGAPAGAGAARGAALGPAPPAAQHPAPPGAVAMLRTLRAHVAEAAEALAARRAGLARKRALTADARRLVADLAGRTVGGGEGGEGGRLWVTAWRWRVAGGVAAAEAVVQDSGGGGGAARRPLLAQARLVLVPRGPCVRPLATLPGQVRAEPGGDGAPAAVAVPATARLDAALAPAPRALLDAYVLCPAADGTLLAAPAGVVEAGWDAVAGGRADAAPPGWPCQGRGAGAGAGAPGEPATSLEAPDHPAGTPPPACEWVATVTRPAPTVPGGGGGGGGDLACGAAADDDDAGALAAAAAAALAASGLGCASACAAPAGPRRVALIARGPNPAAAAAMGAAAGAALARAGLSLSAPRPHAAPAAVHLLRSAVAALAAECDALAAAVEASLLAQGVAAGGGGGKGRAAGAWAVADAAAAACDAAVAAVL